MQQIANSYEKIRLADVVKDVRLKQSVQKSMDGNYYRVYRLSLDFESVKMIKQKLGISFTQLCKIFSDNFVP